MQTIIVCSEKVWPPFREDNLMELHSTIRRYIIKDNENYRDTLKALAELKSVLQKDEARLQEKKDLRYS